MTNLNRELGTDAELANLVNKIRGYDYDNATADDHLALTRALKVVAEDVVVRHDRIMEREAELNRRLSLAEVTTELGSVINSLRPKRKEVVASMTEVIPHPEFKARNPVAWETRMALETAIRALFQEFPPETPAHEQAREVVLNKCWDEGIAMLSLRMYGTGVPSQRFVSILMLLGIDADARIIGRIRETMKAKLSSGLT